MKYLSSIGFACVAVLLSYFGVIEFLRVNYFLGTLALIGAMISTGFSFVALDESNGY